MTQIELPNHLTPDHLFAGDNAVPLITRLKRGLNLPKSQVANLVGLPHATQLADLLAKPEITTTLDYLLPYNLHRLKFAEHQISVPILKQASSLSLEALHNLNPVPQDIKSYQYAEHLLTTLDQDIGQWIPQALDLSYYQQPGHPNFLHTQVWDQIYSHHNFKTLIKQVPYNQFIRLFHCTSNNMDRTMFFLNYQYFALAKARLNPDNLDHRAIYESAAAPNWEGRVNDLDKVTASLGLFGISNYKINQTIIAVLTQANPDLDQLTSEAKRRRLYQARNQMNLSDHHKLRRDIVAKHGVDAESRQRAINFVGLLESPENPIRPFLTTYGTEIEDCHTAGIDVDVYTMLNILGFKKGTSNELSPGPFLHWQTTDLVHQTFFDALLIDPYKDKKFQLSLHTNIGRLPNRQLVAQLLRSLQLAGSCWSPNFGNEPNPKVVDSPLDLYYKEPLTRDAEYLHCISCQGIDYWECKDFRLFTPEGLRWHNFAAQNLANAFRALTGFLPKGYQFNDRYALPSDIKSEIMHRHNASFFDQQLALIAVHFLETMSAGIAQTQNLDKFLAETVPMSQIRTLAYSNLQILPIEEVWNRDYIDRNATVIPGQEIKIHGVGYNNAIAFAHATVSHYARQAATVLDNALAYFYQRQAIIPDSHHPSHNATILELNQHFQLLPGVNDPRYILERLKAIRETMNHYHQI